MLKIVLKRKIFIFLIMIFLANFTFAANLEIRVFEGNFGISYVYNSSENRDTISHDVDLIKAYLYDTKTRFGLDLIPVSFNSLNSWKGIAYSSFFNIDFHYSPIDLANMIFAQIYFTGGPSGIKYQINSINHKEDSDQLFDFPLYKYWQINQFHKS